MGNTNTDWASMTDKSIIESIGKYIKHQRLAKNKTQSQIAEHAGINRWTLSQIENGEAISLTSLIQILRALDLLHVLNNFKIETQVSPIALAKLEKQKRQRARNTDNNTNNQSEW
ncbi:hypothetical protein GCM10022291_03020 [Postechiella marina]|uniref:HTH cro/C1-type domain-containing protein n=1 Tax=Postechiella marina TaxID=943941 RepID=A0ABP8BZR6_9FLAO